MLNPQTKLQQNLNTEFLPCVWSWLHNLLPIIYAWKWNLEHWPCDCSRTGQYNICPWSLYTRPSPVPRENSIVGLVLTKRASWECLNHKIVWREMEDKIKVIWLTLIRRAFLMVKFKVLSLILSAMALVFFEFGLPRLFPVSANQFTVSTTELRLYHNRPFKEETISDLALYLIILTYGLTNDSAILSGD